MRVLVSSVFASALALGSAAAFNAGEGPPIAELESEVRAAEQGFADAFARRDAGAFAAYLADDAVFLGGREPLRGKAAILEVWTGRYFEGERPPFSWRPDRVAVSESGDLALSTGPVFDPGGNWVGSFASTWRRGADGRWRVVLDGAPRCESPGAGSEAT